MMWIFINNLFFNSVSLSFTYFIMKGTILNFIIGSYSMLLHNSAKLSIRLPRTRGLASSPIFVKNYRNSSLELVTWYNGIRLSNKCYLTSSLSSLKSLTKRSLSSFSGAIGISFIRSFKYLATCFLTIGEESVANYWKIPVNSCYISLLIAINNSGIMCSTVSFDFKSL